jgi:CubicO group peptidase (beta-lactamase class C family)
VSSLPEQRNDGIIIGSASEIDTTKIVALTKLILKNEYPNIHSLLIARDGKLLYENYFAGTDEIIGRKLGYIEHTVNDLHDCRSISKSITSACIGIALKKGLIKNLDEPIAPYFPEYARHFDAKKKQITIRHLLTMTGGFEWNEEISYRNPANSELQMDLSLDPIDYVLSRPMASQPGTKWNYNGGQSQLLAQILLKTSTETIDTFAEKNLFLPLGITKYEWLPLKPNMPAAASGLRLRSRDLLKIGLVYMKEGVWQNAQIFDKDWAVSSLSPLVSRGGEKGYGFQFWTYIDTVNTVAYRITEARGNGGQRIFFCQDLQLVVITTAGNYNQWDIVNDPHKALTDYIIPAIAKLK